MSLFQSSRCVLKPWESLDPKVDNIYMIGLDHYNIYIYIYIYIYRERERERERERGLYNN